MGFLKTNWKLLVGLILGVWGVLKIRNAFKDDDKPKPVGGLEHLAKVTSEKNKQQREKIIDKVTSVKKNIKNANILQNEEHYEIQANKIHTHMKGFGTDFNAIKEIIESMNLDERLLTYAAFGPRTYIGFSTKDVKDMGGWFVEEFSDWAMYGDVEIEVAREWFKGSAINF